MRGERRFFFVPVLHVVVLNDLVQWTPGTRVEGRGVGLSHLFLRGNQPVHHKCGRKEEYVQSHRDAQRPLELHDI